MDDIAKDPRFAHTLKDPRFKPNLKQKKVKLDKRFKSMLKDDDFKVKFMDKRGRPVSSVSKENLGRLYKYESDGDDSDDSDDDDDENSNGDEEEQVETDDEDVGVAGGEDDDSENQDDEEDQDGSEQESQADQRLVEEDSDSSEEDDGIPDVTDDGPDYARGEGELESSDEEEGEQEVVGGSEEEGLLDHHWNEPDRSAPEAEEITSRLALCNMDWDRIKARDLYVLFNSFVPQGGAVRSVTIYPSEIGKEKMAEEEKLGPREFREGAEVEEGEEEEKENGKLDRAKLRQYQLNRLTYFYGVVVCDSKDTANKIYEECDSMEYEKSSCRVDLRFVPEDMTFDDTPKDSCTGVSDFSTFEPSTFTTTAFCQAKVQVTWDETNIERLNKTMKKTFTEEDLEADKYKDIIGSSEDESSSEENTSVTEKNVKTKKNKDGQKKLTNYRKLLGLDDDETSKKKQKKKKGVQPFVGEDDEEEEEDVDSDSPVDNKSKKKDKKKKKEKNKKALLSVDSDGEEEEEEKEEEQGEMEFTWEPEANLKKEAKKKLTPWEQYQQKKKEKKKEKKRERKLERMRQKGIEDTTDLGFDDDFFKDDPDIGMMKDKKKFKKKRKKEEEDADKEETEAEARERAALELLVKDDGNDRSHFSLLKLMREENSGKKKKKGKKRKLDEDVGEDNFRVDLSQSRFAGLLDDPEMRIDPNAPEFKKTKAMMTLMEEVSRKRKPLGGVL